MQEARLRAIGLPLDDIKHFPLPLDLPPRERGERGIKLMKAGYLGPRHNYKGPDDEATEILFDQMARGADGTAVKPGTVLQWQFDDAEPWHLVLDNGSTNAARGLHPSPTLTLTSRFEDFVDLGAARVDPGKLMLTRKIKPRGDLRLLLKLPKVFG